MATLLFMMLGTAMELYLLDHYEDTLQLIPLLCIGLSLLVFIILLFQKTKFLRLAFQILMVLTALSGMVGAYLHFQANFEFEQEMKPTAGIWDLLTESLSGALPTLAPGSMIVLALIGYSYLILLKHKQ
ncbi:MAG: hypothetical protein AAFU64_08845, partial [Bacteroidota bacterium]